MIWFMNSKDMETFLNNETDDSILEAQYVIVSNRIRRVGTTHDNIVQANVLFPNPDVMGKILDDSDLGEFEEAYFRQLDDNKTLLAILIESVIVKGYNIILLCTKKEEKLGDYLDKIAKYIFNEFDFPVYNYIDFVKGKIDVMDYDESKVYKKCHKIVTNAKQKDVLIKVNNDKKLSDGNKKRLKSLLKEHGLYQKGMTLQEMINIADVFLSND